MSGQNFVDYVKICCRSGKGGAGSVHMLRDRTTAKGGPDGGDEAEWTYYRRGFRNKWTLLHLKYQRHIIASHGGGSGNRKHGADGEDVIIEVPLGTIIKDADTEEVYEITDHDQEIIISKVVVVVEK